jgi:hypothetical protein
VSNYTQSTNFATKDALTSGDPLKIVKGTEINTEFANIAIAVATKADLSSPTFTGTPTLPTGTIATTQSFGNSTTALATTAFVQAALQILHPIGSIYTATVSTNPGTLLGFGTWATFGSGRMLISQDATYTAGSTGGFATTTLITANLPSHSHTFTGNALPSHSHSYTTPVGGFTLSGSGGTGSDPGTTGGASGGTPTGTIGNTGSGTAVTTISPYIAVYMWQRTA